MLNSQFQSRINFLYSKPACLEFFFRLELIDKPSSRLQQSVIVADLSLLQVIFQMHSRHAPVYLFS